MKRRSFGVSEDSCLGGLWGEERGREVEIVRRRQLVLLHMSVEIRLLTEAAVAPGAAKRLLLVVDISHVAL